MIQPTYISERKCGNKWYPMDDLPVPLLRTNYLSEFRTEIEKAQARKNLGIPDEMQMKWGGMSGYVEEQRDLVEYMEMKWRYTTPLSEDIETVALALDHIMLLITSYTNLKEEMAEVKDVISELGKDIEDTKSLINTAHEALLADIDLNEENISKLQELIDLINLSIEKLNTDLVNINVDPNIQAWVEVHSSSTIKLEEDKLLVAISKAEGNSLTNNGGLFVKDNSQDIANNLKAIEELQEALEDINETIEKLQDTIDLVKATVDGLNILASGYNTTLAETLTAPTAVGGIKAGTTVGELKGKTLVDIIDIMLFPTTVRDLVYPTLSYRPATQQLIEVGSAFTRPVLTFTKNDAGPETERTEKVTFNGTEIEVTAYDQLGTYKYSATVKYAAGEYLLDSKGNVTDKRVEAGSKTASVSYVTTYPWYAGNKSSVTKQALVQFGSASGEKTITMGGLATIKLPGSGSTIKSFTVDGGLGYTAVNLGGWSETTEQLNGITYKVWTKNDPYQSDLSHKINFTLAL